MDRQDQDGTTNGKLSEATRFEVFVTYPDALHSAPDASSIFPGLCGLQSVLGVLKRPPRCRTWSVSTTLISRFRVVALKAGVSGIGAEINEI